MDSLMGWLAIGGAALLAALIAFAMFRQRGVTRAEHAAGERATRDLYSPSHRDRPQDDE